MHKQKIYQKRTEPDCVSDSNHLFAFSATNWKHTCTCVNVYIIKKFHIQLTNTIRNNLMDT